MIRSGQGPGDLAPPVRRLLFRAHRLWKRMHPTHAALWGSVPTEHTEDLSPGGVRKWQEDLCDLQQQMALVRSQPGSPADFLVTGELQRFLNEQRMLHIDQRVFETRASPYLNLILLALLPFAVPAQLQQVDRDTLLEHRLEACAQWLDEGERRIVSGSLAISPHDCKTACHLSDELCRWLDPQWRPVSRLVERLERWSQMPLRQPQQLPPPVTPEWYLEAVLESRFGVELLRRTLTEHLKEQVLLLKEAVRRTDEAEAHVAGAACGGGECDRHRWPIPLSEMAGVLRKAARGKCLVQATTVVDMQPIPDLFRPLVGEGAMYLPHAYGSGKAFGVSGTLLWSPALLASGQQDPLKQCARWALTLCHEVCPGHAEQLERAHSSPLAPLFAVTRSPMGLEGWAVASEEFVASLSDLGLAGEVLLRRSMVRRFLAAVLAVDPHRGDGEYRRKFTAEALAPLPQPERERLGVAVARMLAQNRYAPLAYVLGLLEVRAALTRIAVVLATVPSDPQVAEAYLRTGPAAPWRVSHLIESTS